MSKEKEQTPAIETPLIQAIRAGDEKQVQQILSQSSEAVNTKSLDKPPKSPLQLAAYGNNSKIIELLITHGANSDHEFYFDTLRSYTYNSKNTAIEQLGNNKPKLAFLRAQYAAKKMSEGLPPDPLDSKEDKYTANVLKALKDKLDALKKQNSKMDVSQLDALIKNFEEQPSKNAHETLSRLRAFYKAMEELHVHLYAQYEKEIAPIVNSVRNIYRETILARFNDAHSREMAKFKEAHPKWNLEVKGSQAVTLAELQKNLEKFAPKWEVNEFLAQTLHFWARKKDMEDKPVDCYCAIQAFLTLYQEKDPGVKNRGVEKLELNRLSGSILSDVQYLQLSRDDIFTVEKEVGQDELTKVKDQKAEDQPRAPPAHAQLLRQKPQGSPPKEGDKLGNVSNSTPKPSSDESTGILAWVRKHL